MRNILIALIILMILPACNIVPKSVQYQKEEEGTIGSVDGINLLVEEAQVMFSNLGYDTGNKDGRMGQKTREAIREFQESIGLKSTGYIDKLTWRAIEDIRRDIERSEMKEKYIVTVKSAYKEEISSPDFNVTIKEIQAALKNAGFDPGTLDGKMGPRTQQAAKEFQRAKGLKVDGKVGPKTWSELKKYAE
ncbi:MAG: peptidoglycan-binding protein [Candidatus Omnitrophica bacterium]|nr:peptidoglycan-binding protein [Candidatus Omnitrophota bacterium]MBU4590403.1 peptidoglycan-binding protein [Candidatus Omnitrophota bacterium]